MPSLLMVFLSISFKKLPWFINRIRVREGEVKAEERRALEAEFEKRKWENPVEFLEIVTGQIELEMLTIEESVFKENITPEVLQQDPLALQIPPAIICIACDNPRGADNHGVLHTGSGTVHLGFCGECIQTYKVGQPCFVCRQLVDMHIKG